MERVKLEKLDLDGNPTGVIVDFEPKMAEKLLNSKVFGSFQRVKKPQPKGRNVKK